MNSSQLYVFLSKLQATKFSFSTWVTIAWLIPQMVSLQLIAADLNSFSDNADIIRRGELIKIF